MSLGGTSECKDRHPTAASDASNPMLCHHQMQCILQIIVNRVGLILPNKARVRNIKISVFVVIAMINVSVFCIWIPARLQISERYVRINDIWDRTEKALFALVDGALNVYFIWVVRTKLIDNGLIKYRPLFRYNVSMVCVSLLLDVSSEAWGGGLGNVGN